MWKWSEEKNRANRRKHGLAFETARLVFSDPLAQTLPDPSEYEVRWRTYGMISGILVLVVHTEPEIDDTTCVRAGRIISARKATPRERAAYENSAYG